MPAVAQTNFQKCCSLKRVNFASYTMQKKKKSSYTTKQHYSLKFISLRSNSSPLTWYEKEIMWKYFSFQRSSTDEKKYCFFRCYRAPPHDPKFGRGKPKWWIQTKSFCSVTFFHHKPNMDRSGIETGPPRLKAAD